MSVNILIGDCREMLRTLPDESVHCVVTSPPYWGLRDYGACPCGSGRFDLGQGTGTGGNLNYRSAQKFNEHCSKCNGTGRVIAMDTQLGLERSLGEHVQAMVEVFREVRRVLRRDGSLWLNYGDSYATGGNQTTGYNDPNWVKTGGACNGGPRVQVGSSGLKPKDLCGVPWRVAFALQADGWWLRSDIIWSKPNPMPESVTDRPTKAHEYLFLLTKAERYYYDAEAIKEDVSGGAHPGRKDGGIPQPRGGGIDTGGARLSMPGGLVESRNRRTVWEIATAPFSEAHFATFPPALIEPCIKAGTSEKGCCAKCGKPWVRKVGSASGGAIGKAWGDHSRDAEAGNAKTASSKGYQAGKTLGWSPSCSCEDECYIDNHPTPWAVPCTVLDPFGGAGTTGLVADRLQRNAILIELNPEYAAMARRRIDGDAPLFTNAPSPFGSNTERGSAAVGQQGAEGAQLRLD